MNRRQFLTRLSAVAATAFVASKLPLGLLPAQPQLSVTTRLRNAWVAFTKGSGAAHMPTHMWVSQEVFDAYKAEELGSGRYRWVTNPQHPIGLRGNLVFKGTEMSVMNHPRLHKWDVYFASPLRTKVVRA